MEIKCYPPIPESAEKYPSMTFAPLSAHPYYPALCLHHQQVEKTPPPSS